MKIILQKWELLDYDEDEHLLGFLNKEINHSQLSKIIADVEKTLNLAFNKNHSSKSTNVKLLSHLNQYHVDVVQSVKEVIMHKGRGAIAILVNILKTVAKKPVKEALPIIRAECIESGLWKSIYPAIRDVYLGFDRHVEALMQISHKYPDVQLVQFVPFVLPEIMSKLKHMSTSMAEYFLKPVAENIIIDMKKQYDLIVEGYDRIIANIKGRIIRKLNNTHLKIPSSIEIKFSDYIAPGIASSTGKIRTVHHNSIASKPTEKTIEVNNNLKFEYIQTKVVEKYNQMMHLLDLNNDKSIENEMEDRKCLHIQNELDKFTDEVNAFATEWMQMLYDTILRT